MEEEDYTKLPVEEACTHKVWKARLVGYEAALKHFQCIEDEKSSEWNKYVGLVKKFVVDSHALCQEKGLEAVLVFVDNCGLAGRTVGDVVSGIVQKCLAASKARTKELGAQIILMYVEIEKFEIVMEELTKGTESKNPKVSAACVHILAQILKEFGPKVIGVSKLIKKLLPLLEDRDVNVRAETRMLLCEIYHWLGSPIKPQLIANLKPPQLAEVEAEFEKVKNTPAKPTRLLRSLQTQEAAEVEDLVNAEGDEKDGLDITVEEIDPYELLDPVDILSQLNKEFYPKLEAKKWTDRKEVLEELEKQLASAPKLEAGDYGDLLRALKKIIGKDANVVVVAIAIKCVTGIANGLKKKFHTYAGFMMSTLYEKFKEKKPNVVLALRDAVDAVYVTTSLEVLIEDIIVNLENKNPSVKIEMTAFLSRCFSKSTPVILTKKILKTFCKSLTTALKDQDPLVRDNSALALGTAMKVVGEKAIGPYLVDVDQLIMKKVKEHSEKAVLVVKQPRATKVQKVRKAVPEQSKPEKPMKESPKQKKVLSKGAQAIKEKDAPVIPADEPSEKPMSAENKSKVDIGTHMTDAWLSELADKNWKVRAEAIAKLQAIINSAQSITSSMGEAPPVIAARISDPNIKISASAITLVESLAPAMGPPCKQYIRVFLPALLRAIGDPKAWIRSAVVPCLNTWGDICGFKEFFDGEVIADALKSGSPTVRSELWGWLADKLPNIPPKSIPKDELTTCLPTLFSNLEDRNADVRKNACESVLGFMLHLGFSNMMQACDNIVKGSGGAQVKLILEKTRGSLPVQPIQKSESSGSNKKSIRPGTAELPPGSSATITKSKSKGGIPPSKSSSSLRKKEEEGDNGPLLQINSLKHQRNVDEQKLKTLRWNFVTPRPEFVELLKDLMTTANVNKMHIANMFHSDFRYHLRALDALTEDLSANKEALKCNLDLILKWMTLRFFDTNPSVLLKGLEYLSLVFNILIEENYTLLDCEASSFFPYLIIKVGDSKDTVRNSVRALFRQISQIYPASKQFLHVIEGSKSKNARQRSECLEQLSWLIENYGLTVCNPSPASALKEIAKHIADRDTSVRNAALNCVVTAHFIDEKVMKMVGRISEKDMSLLEERIKRAYKNRPAPTGKTPVQIPNSQPTDSVPDNVLEEESCKEPEPLDEVPEPVIIKPQLNLSPPRVRPTSGAYGIDRTIVDKIECSSAHFQAPKLVDIDLQFLKEQAQQTSFKPINMNKLTPTLSNYSQPSAIKRELVNIASCDIDKALTAIQKIDTILSSDEKRANLSGYVDHMVSQLVHSIVILNQSAHPEVVNCYKANFSLLMKLCNHPELCCQISETTLNKILEQFLLLLTEPRLETINKNEMFVRVVNNLVIRLLEHSNKTNVMCALLKILYSNVNNPKATNHFKDLAVKCLWKLNKTQPEWDSELDYSRILLEFHTFLKDYPTAWWKNKDIDYPLRTVKTVLHTMIKIRGTEVKDIADRMPNVSTDSELYSYIKKVIKHLKVSDQIKDSNPTKENEPRNIIHSTTPRISKETQDELSEIFRMIGDCDETYRGMKRLYEFVKSHPEADVQPFLSKTTPQFQQYIKRGLQTEEQQQVEVADSNKNENINVMKSSEQFTEEAELLWNRLKHLQEQSGCPVDKREEVSDRLKELPNLVVGTNIK